MALSKEQQRNHYHPVPGIERTFPSGLCALRYSSQSQAKALAAYRINKSEANIFRSIFAKQWLNQTNLEFNIIISFHIPAVDARPKFPSPSTACANIITFLFPRTYARKSVRCIPWPQVENCVKAVIRSSNIDVTDWPHRGRKLMVQMVCRWVWSGLVDRS